MSLDDPNVFFGALTIVLGLFSLLNSFMGAAIQRRIERRTRAADLYDDYYSPDNYRRVVLPVTRIALKWRALPEPEREAYRDVVRDGWLVEENNVKKSLEAFISPENICDDPAKMHFRDNLSSEAFTEHEALTVFLYFWTKVYEMARANVISRDIAIRLLKRPYAYNATFIAALREDILKHSTKGHEPVWVQATLGLEKMFA